MSTNTNYEDEYKAALKRKQERDEAKAKAQEDAKRHKSDASPGDALAGSSSSQSAPQSSAPATAPSAAPSATLPCPLPSFILTIEQGQSALSFDKMKLKKLSEALSLPTDGSRHELMLRILRCCGSVSDSSTIVFDSEKADFVFPDFQQQDFQQPATQPQA